MKTSCYGANGHLGTTKSAVYLYYHVWQPPLVPIIANFMRVYTDYYQNKDRTQLSQGLHQRMESSVHRFYTYTMIFMIYLPLFNEYNSIFPVIDKIT